MIVEVWVVMMPNGDRLFTRSSPPSSELSEKWKAEGARIFRMTGQVPDQPRLDGPHHATITET